MKTTRLITTILVLSLLLSILTGITVAALELNEGLIIEDSFGEDELMPTAATACWNDLETALNYYIGKNNWSYDDDDNPVAEGFTITVHTNGLCSIRGDDVYYTFRITP